jgi:alpha/beta superfamily hydrolase
LETDTRTVSIPNGDIALEAVLHTPAGVAPAGLVVVCHPHPQYGGSMDNTVVLALCEGALQEGLAALRFNFRGVGGSGGSYTGGSGEREDVRSVLAASRDLLGAASIALAGYSFGAAMAVLSGYDTSGVQALVLVSPPLRMIGASDFTPFSANVLLLAGDADPICPAADLEALAARLEPPADCRIVEGAGHSWLGYESDLRASAGAFLRWQRT